MYFVVAYFTDAKTHVEYSIAFVIVFRKFCVGILVGTPDILVDTPDIFFFRYTRHVGRYIRHSVRYTRHFGRYTRHSVRYTKHFDRYTRHSVRYARHFGDTPDILFGTPELVGTSDILFGTPDILVGTPEICSVHQTFWSAHQTFCSVHQTFWSVHQAFFLFGTPDILAIHQTFCSVHQKFVRYTRHFDRYTRHSYCCLSSFCFHFLQAWYAFWANESVVKHDANKRVFTYYSICISRVCIKISIVLWSKYVWCSSAAEIRCAIRPSRATSTNVIYIIWGNDSIVK